MSTETNTPILAPGDCVLVTDYAKSILPRDTLGDTLTVDAVGRFGLVTLRNPATGQRYTLPPWEARRCLEVVLRREEEPRHRKRKPGAEESRK